MAILGADADSTGGLMTGRARPCTPWSSKGAMDAWIGRGCGWCDRWEVAEGGL